MITPLGNELAECLENHLSPLNDIDDSVANSSAECNYEDFEEFTDSVDSNLFEQEWTGILKELKKKTENLLISGEKCDVRLVFEESSVATMKFNLFVWYFLEKGKNSDSTEDEVENAVLTASSYVAMCAMPGSNYDLFQIGLYKKCLKVVQNCCQTIRIGETVKSKKGAGGAKKKKSKSVAEETHNEEEDANSAPTLGPPRISVDSAESYLQQLTTQLFGFLTDDVFSLDAQTLLSTLEVIEEIGRLDLETRTVTKPHRANSVHEFRSLERFIDRYCSFIHALIESKYHTRREMAYGRLIRPRLALMPYPDEGNKTSKITPARKKAGELIVSLLLERISRKPEAKELKLIETVLGMVYVQCPDLAEFRTNIAVFIHKILSALPYQYAYDFVQLMHLVFKNRAPGVKSLSTELCNTLLSDFDFSAPDPGPVPEIENENNDVEEEEEDEEDDEEEVQEKEARDRDTERFVEDESEDEGNKTRRKKENKKKEKKKPHVDIPRLDAMSVLYNIVYMACLDKAAAIRLHGSNSFAKIISSDVHRNEFHECCQKMNAEMDEKLGEIGEHLNETIDDNDEAPTKKGKTDLLLNEQQIIQKFHKLKMMNKGEARIEKDIIYMLVRRLATDEKAPVKKSACVLLKTFLCYCDEQVKFEVTLSVLQKMCRDKMVTVRKTAADAITELMLQENVKFKEILSSKWLHSLITMLNDTDNDVTEHARKLIMKVLTPLLENTSELTWTLLDTIESVTNHRQYLMSTLKDAVREKLVKKTVMDSMKAHISQRLDDRKSGAWMVFSQLCVQFEQNVDFAIEAFHSTDLSVESNLVQYMIHVIENSKKIEAVTKTDLVKSMQRTLATFCLHPSHARSVYHCLGKLMDGIGDRATNGPAFREFAEELLIKCFDTIVQSFEMFKNTGEWKKNSEGQERLLVVTLNVVSEVFAFSPQLIPRHERLGKTLSLIVNSHDGQRADASAVNPEMPSAHITRPPTQLSEIPSSQKTSGGLMCHEDGVMFSDKVRAVCVITLANMILAHDRLLKLMPMLVKQLQSNQSHQIRSNIVVAIGDICASYKTDRYAPMLAASLCDPSVLVRRHAINQIARLISLGIFRFNGEIMIRVMLATLDANEDVRNDAKLYISEVLQSEEQNFFPLNFVQYMLALTQAKRLIGTSHDEDDRGQVDVAIGGGVPLARPSRIAIYTFMIESLDDRSRFEVKRSICQRIFTPIVNGEYDFGDYNVQCLLDDALLIMSSNEMQVKMEVGKNPNENAVEEPSAEAFEAAANFMQKIYLDHYMNQIVPSILALREFLNQHRSPLQRKCIIAIRMICTEHKNDLDVILRDNRQLKDEITFEMNRVKQRTEEANRILDEYLKKVADFHKKQRRMSRAAVDQQPDDVEMTSPVPSNQEEDVPSDAMCTPQKQPAVPKTPVTAMRTRTELQSTPQSRPLSPKTLKKIRRSVGALIKNNETRLNAPDLNDTQLDEMVQCSEENSKIAPKEKTIVEEEVGGEAEEDEEEKTVIGEIPSKTAEEQDETAMETAKEPSQLQQPSEVPADAEENQGSADRSRSRRRKTPNYDDDESVDSEGTVWKKPKIAPKSPENAAENSMNVTTRRSRKTGHTEKTAEPKRSNKRKSTDEVECADENRENSPSSHEVTALYFDENKVGAGRQCSTPIKGRDDADAIDVTFSLNLSAITEREELKSRKSQAQLLHNIFEEDEDGEES